MMSCVEGIQTDNIPKCMVVLRSTKDMKVCQMGPGKKAGAESAAKMLGPPPIGEAFFTNVPPTRGGLGLVD